MFFTYDARPGTQPLPAQPWETTIRITVEQLRLTLTLPDAIDPAAASVVNGLLGGRFGDLAALNSYRFQAIRFRDGTVPGPIRALVANLAAEKLAHLDLIAAAVDGLLPPSRGADGDGLDPAAGGGAPALPSGGGPAPAMPAGSGGEPPAAPRAQGWSGDQAFASGRPMLDLLHDVFLANAARIVRLQAYAATANPAARGVVGYVLVRDGVHAQAQALALEWLTGVAMRRMLPRLDEAEAVPESRPFLAAGLHRCLYRFDAAAEHELRAIWRGESPDGSGPLDFLDAAAPSAPGAVPPSGTGT